MNPDNNDILASLATDLEAYYEQLVPMYWQQLRTFVLRRTGSPQDAEDIVQEAFIRAYLALERYSVEQIQTLKVRQWLYKITWNVYCNYMGRSKAPPSVSLDVLEDDSLLEREDDRNEQPDLAFENVEQRQELEALVATLPAHYGEPVSLYYFDDLSHSEIAEILHQPLGTVKVYVRRGIRLLQKALTIQTN
ncbi:MAG TPA: RNA polymerase sigma factor [Ktedonobacteraceae bacterium]|nr:RNA polymerase sigma factor [Ktedonobacteraceae bacterium]